MRKYILQGADVKIAHEFLNFIVYEHTIVY